MGLCHSTAGFTGARANYPPGRKKNWENFISRESGIWMGVNKEGNNQKPWEGKQKTWETRKTKSTGDKKNRGNKEVLQRKEWNCVWESLVEMLRQTRWSLFMAFKILTKQEEFHMKSKCHEINKMNIYQSFCQLFKLHFFITFDFSHLFYSTWNVKLMEQKWFFIFSRQYKTFPLLQYPVLKTCWIKLRNWKANLWLNLNVDLKKGFRHWQIYIWRETKYLS